MWNGTGNPESTELSYIYTHEIEMSPGTSVAFSESCGPCPCMGSVWEDITTSNFANVHITLIKNNRKSMQMQQRMNCTKDGIMIYKR